MTDTDIDPIEELADTLYDALYAITPYAEPHFADERQGLRDAVQAVLSQAAAQAWVQKQLDETGLKAMDFRNGMSMELEPAREMVAHWVGAARGMLGNAPNYSETPIEMVVKVGESPERFAFTLQRVGKLTPHQARQQAETKLSNAQKLVDGWKQASEEHAAFAQSKVMNETPGMADKQTGRSDQLADCANELADVLNGENPDDWEYGIGLDVTEAGDRDA